MIGAAKELVEATAKHVLLELGAEVPENADLPGLSKMALGKLKLHPEAIAPTTKGAEVMARSWVAWGRRRVGWPSCATWAMAQATAPDGGSRDWRAAMLSLPRVAIAYTTFVLDTLNDPAAPWHMNAEDPNS